MRVPSDYRRRIVVNLIFLFLLKLSCFYKFDSSISSLRDFNYVLFCCAIDIKSLTGLEILESRRDDIIMS